MKKQNYRHYRSSNKSAAYLYALASLLFASGLSATTIGRNQTFTAGSDADFDNASPNPVYINEGTLRINSSFDTARKIIMLEDEDHIPTMIVDSGVTTTWSGISDQCDDCEFIKAGAGTLVLSGAATNRDDFIVREGIVRAGTENLFETYPDSEMKIASGATLDLNDFNQIVNELSDDDYRGGGTVLLGTATLTVNESYSEDSKFSGSIQGEGNLVKTGTGTLALTGNNTYTGSTTINQGTLVVYSDTGTYRMADLHINSGARLFVGGDYRSHSTYNKVHVNDLSGNGTIVLRINSAQNQGDQLIIEGSATGNHSVSVINRSGNKGDVYRLISFVDPSSNNANFSLLGGGTLVFGDPSLGQDPNGYYLNVQNTNVSHDIAVINATAAIAPIEFFYNMNALHKRMGDVRAEFLKNPQPATEMTPTQDGSMASPTEGSEKRPGGNLWFRGQAYNLKADKSLTGTSLDEDIYGIYIGGDKAFNGENGVFLLGLFVNYNYADRDFHKGSSGSTDSYGVGIYGTWLSESGWFTDIVLKSDWNENDFDAKIDNGYKVSGNYDNDMQGLSIELGKKFGGNDGGFWIEPSIQGKFVFMNSASYRTDDRLKVDVDDGIATQYHGTLRFGRDFKGEMTFHPYGKVGAFYTDSSDGDVKTDGEIFSTEIEGWGWMFGIGTAFILNTNNQIYFDYEYADGDDFERPWAFNLGYRYTW